MIEKRGLKLTNGNIERMIGENFHITIRRGHHLYYLLVNYIDLVRMDKFKVEDRTKLPDTNKY